MGRSAPILPPARPPPPLSLLPPPPSPPPPCRWAATRRPVPGGLPLAQWWRRLRTTRSSRAKVGALRPPCQWYGGCPQTAPRSYSGCARMSPSTRISFHEKRPLARERKWWAGDCGGGAMEPTVRTRGWSERGRYEQPGLFGAFGGALQLSPRSVLVLREVRRGAGGRRAVARGGGDPQRRRGPPGGAGSRTRALRRGGMPRQRPLGRSVVALLWSGLAVVAPVGSARP